MLLPKDFDELLKRGDLDELKAIFDACDLNARDRDFKQPTLAFDECPDALACWLVAQGANLAATDAWGATPLHTRSWSRQGRIAILLELGADIHSHSPTGGSPLRGGTPLHAAAFGHNVENVRLLLDRGAQVDSLDDAGLTPLELALRYCENIHIEAMPTLAKSLLSAGARQTPRMKTFVEEIGKRFEFSREVFNPKFVDAFSDALSELYALFDVPPAPLRKLHDAKTSIVVEATDWREQHQELWELLVPGRGPAATVQGEVIRISGRIEYELDNNGGDNWDADFKRMADAFLKHIQKGNPLPPTELAEAAALIVEVKRKSGNVVRMCQLAVAWALLNPSPIMLKPPTYHR